jgi:uroporphyrinogen-III synthase
VIPRELRKMGGTVDVIEAYETVIPKSSRKRFQALMKNPKLRPDIITFTSSSTVRNFVELLDLPRPQEQGRARSVGMPDRSRKSIHRIRFASIGPVTSATLRQFGLPVHIESNRYTVHGLIQAMRTNNK